MNFATYVSRQTTTSPIIYSIERPSRVNLEAGTFTVTDNQLDLAIDANERAISTAMIGSTQRVLVDEPGVARGQADAPDIDGRVYLPITAPVGEFTEVRITSSEEYDLLALPSGQGPAVRRTARQAQ